jgi:heptosyltransferase-2
VRLDAERGLLVRLPNWLGDAVACEPVVRALAREFERAACPERLSLCAPRRLLALFECVNPRARRIAAEEGWRPWRGHGTALLLVGSFRSAAQCVLAGIERRVGVARDGRGLLLSDALAPALERGGAALGTPRRGRWPRLLPRPVGAVALELAALLGVAVDDVAPRLRASDEVRARVDAELGEALGGEPFVLVNAGGREASAKALPVEHWEHLAATAPPHLTLALTSGPGEEAAARELAAALARRGRRARYVLTGGAPTLAEYLALLERCALFVTTDTGPRHLARAVGARAVVLFGPTDPRHTNEGLGREQLVLGRADCAPCHRERCPLPAPRERECLRDAAQRFAQRPQW